MSSVSTANLGWIVLGFGAALVLALILALVLGLRAVLRGRAAGNFRGTYAYVPGADPGPLPTEIMAALDAVPPLERPRAAKAYRGMPVRWRVSYETAFASGVTTLRLMSTEWGTSYPWVFCDVRKGRYPPLRGLLKHTPFWISGRINNIKINDIYLRGVRLEFED